MVAQAKSGGMLDYMRSFPVPRMAYLAADLTIWLLSTLPGVILALVVGSLRYDFELQFSPLIVPAFILVVLMATSVGYAIALLLPKAELVSVLTNLIIFSLFLFSPINFPIERLPPGLHYPPLPSGEVCRRHGTRRVGAWLLEQAGFGAGRPERLVPGGAGHKLHGGDPPGVIVPPSGPNTSDFMRARCRFSEV